ncbi:MAG: hypothetical protein ACON4Z_12455, partial [Planctomycetota bacterium]
MDPGPTLLALRFEGQTYALEPGRSYLLGSAAECDLRVPGAAPHHARLDVTPDDATVVDLSGAEGLLHNEVRVASARLRPGDRVAVAGELMVVAEDDGAAALVPIPALREAASQRRILQVRAAAAALRRQDRSFADLVAEGLRDAPWLALSVALHALLILLLAIYAPRFEVSGDGVATISVDVRAGAPIGDGPPAPPEVVVEEADDFDVEDPDPLEDLTPEPVFDGPVEAPPQPTENPTLTVRERPQRSGSGGSALLAEDGVGSGSFRERVAELQESGLEVVFVFDSTGSMTRTIQDTKATIADMCEVLRALVPDARVGLVTYRDRGEREDYLVRSVPLALDHWRASNFVQHVTAEGGGDRPEAVRAGLRAAIGLRWQPRAQRVIVLAGDAPTHKRDLEGLLRDVKAFARNRRSFVHTLITSPDRAGADTHDQFQRIAAHGRGVCEPLQNHEQVLQRVLTLAFGRQFDRDIDAVLAEAARQRGQVDTASLHLVRRAGPQLAAALRRHPVPPALWNAVVRKPRAAVATVVRAQHRAPPPPPPPPPPRAAARHPGRTQE